MAKETVGTGQVVQKSGIYATGRAKIPEIALSRVTAFPLLMARRRKLS